MDFHHILNPKPFPKLTRACPVWPLPTSATSSPTPLTLILLEAPNWFLKTKNKQKKLYLFTFREGKERGRERAMCEKYIDLHRSVVSRKPPTWPQPRHVPWPGIKPVTFQFAGRHSIHWATPARALLGSLESCFCDSHLPLFSFHHF